TLYGEPLWQPDGGIVAGALQLDGVDDYVDTPFILNPVNGPLSVFVWIKGGAPGQVVISQTGDGANWLCMDSVQGRLMTELTTLGRGYSSLLSQTVITDGNWHRIGFVWDGSYRTLYVDGIVAAEDTQDGLGGSYDGLYLGCDKNMEAGTFFSGMIDDVRIYNRVVIP
ncbi:MAG: LamG domain-containing protein, partial [Planctomycetota bacterium]